MRRFVSILILASVFISSAHLEAAKPSVALHSDEPALDVDTKLHIGPMILTSFSLCAVAVGAGFGWQADQEYDDWREARKAGMGDEMDEIAKDVRKHSIAGNVLMFGGAALAATGIIWWIVAAKSSQKGEGETAALDWRPSFGPGSASLTVSF